MYPTDIIIHTHFEQLGQVMIQAKTPVFSLLELSFVGVTSPYPAAMTAWTSKLRYLSLEFSSWSSKVRYKSTFSAFEKFYTRFSP